MNPNQEILKNKLEIVKTKKHIEKLDKTLNSIEKKQLEKHKNNEPLKKEYHSELVRKKEIIRKKEITKEEI